MTTQRTSSIISMCMPVLAVVFFISCSKKDVMMEEPLMSPSGPSPDTGAAAAAPAAPTGESMGTEGAGVPGAISSELKEAYFDFDSYSLRYDARDVLKANASWLKANPSAMVQMEGHCDERGTTEYNLALGERRANAARDYLVKIGVEASRVSVISYGEERPNDPGHDEMAWSRNRRAVSVVTSK